MTNTGPFTDPLDDDYWTGTCWAPDPGYEAYVFYFWDGCQGVQGIGIIKYAWPVRPGARAATPS